MAAIIKEKKKENEQFDEKDSARELDSLLKERRMTQSIGIPTAGNTRQWNNQHMTMDYQIEHMNALLSL